MTVAELIDRLRECDPDARVVLVLQPSWPLEHALAGIAIRRDVDETNDAHRGPDDVLLVEGTQLGYGNRGAWDACR